MRLSEADAEPGWPTSRMRLAVLAAAVVATALKLEVAAHTFGTNDVRYWRQFAGGVRRFGPVGIYGHHFEAVYNHGPLAGWLLAGLNWLHDRGVAGFPFLIRLPACLADLVSAVLVFELVRVRRSTREATLAALLVVFSPVLVVVSGFHGNTDPVIIMFSLLAVYLLVVRRWAFAAGLAYGAAVSVKLVPVVLAPTLAVIVLRLGRRRAVAFAAGGGCLFLLLWVPVIVRRWTAFRTDALGYVGGPARQWGLIQFLSWAHVPAGIVVRAAGSGRFLLLLASALAAAAVAWRRPEAAVAAAGLALVLLLVLTPAFGMQYLVWALAAAYLVDVRAATAYNAAASVFVVAVYDHWNGAPPWRWDVARADVFRPLELALMVVTWLALAGVAVTGLRSARGVRVP